MGKSGCEGRGDSETQIIPGYQEPSLYKQRVACTVTGTGRCLLVEREVSQATRSLGIPAEGRSPPCRVHPAALQLEQTLICIYLF